MCLDQIFKLVQILNLHQLKKTFETSLFSIYFCMCE
jgi:hypothetical protein